MSLSQRRLHPNAAVDHLAAQWTQAMSAFDQMVSSMTKPSIIAAANQFGPTAGKEATSHLATLRRAFTSSTSPLALAASQYRADIEAALPLAETMEGCGDFVAAAEHAFRERAEGALPLRTVRDALAAVEWVRGDLAERESGSEEHWPADVAHRHLLLTGAAALLREVQEAGAVVFSAQGLETTQIPDLGMTFREAADRAAALIAESNDDDRDDNIPEVEAEMNARCDEYNRIHAAVLSSPAVTVGDFLAKIARIVCPNLGLDAFEGAGVFGGLSGTAEAIRNDLEKIRGGSMAVTLSEPAHSEMSDAFRRFMDLRESFDHLPENREPNQEELAEEDRLFSIITDRPANNATDALAQLALFILVNMGDSIIDLEDDESGYARALHQGLAYFASVGDPSMGKLFADAPIRERGARAFWARIEPAECVEPEGASLEDEETPEEDKRLATDGVESGLSNDDSRLMGLFKKLDPNGKEAVISIGQAMVALEDAMEMARKAIALDQRWAGFFAKLLKEDAAALSRGLVLESEDDHPIAGDAPQPRQVNDSDATADQFADTVATFQNEASAPLAIPQQPTDDMVKAGASAAGIAPEQFAAAYAAAVEALKQERAA